MDTTIVNRTGERVIYPLLAGIYAVLGAFLIAVLVSSFYEAGPLSLVPQFRTIGEPMPWVGGAFLGLAALAALVYAVSLDPFRAERPRGWIVLNFLPPGVFLAAVFLLYFSPSPRDPLFLALGAFVVILTPALALAFEMVMAAGLLALGRAMDERGSRASAYYFLKNSLRWRPSVHETARRCGLLLVEMGRFKRAIPLLERLGSIEASEDAEVLGALERSYRGEGDARKALRCLTRIQKIRPGSKGLLARILDQTIALELWEDAIEILRSGEIALDAGRTDQLFELYLKTDQLPRALALAEEFAAGEGTPFARTTSMLKRLTSKYPDDHELAEKYGLLLLSTHQGGEMELGAEVLEKVLATAPDRADARRRLAEHYSKTLRLQMAEPHFHRLIETGEADLDALLIYADALKSSGRKLEAAEVYQRIRENMEPDWRALSQEADLLFLFGRLEEADQLLALAESITPPASALGVQALRRRVIERRDEARLEVIAEGLNDSGDGAGEKRLKYIDQLLAMERGEQAISQCDILIESHPGLVGRVIEALEAARDSLLHSFRVRDYLADLYFRQSRFGEALEMYRVNAAAAIHRDQALEEGCRRVLARAPEWVDARSDLAEALMRLGRLREAVEQFEWLEERGPEEAKTRARRRRLAAYSALGAADEARVLGLDMLERSETDLEVYRILIWALQSLNERKAAHRVLLAALEEFPDDDGLQRVERGIGEDARRERLAELDAKIAAGEGGARAHYDKADLHRAGAETQQAIIHYQKAAEDPELADVATTKLAICLCDRRLFDIADETLDPVALTKDKIEKYPELRNMFYWVADVLELEDYHDAALKYFKRVFRVDAAFKDVVHRLERLDAS